MNTARSALCRKYRQNSTLIFKPPPFTFEAFYLNIPPCVMERHGPEHSLVITLQAPQVCRVQPSLQQLFVPHKSFTGVQVWGVCQSSELAVVVDIQTVTYSTMMPQR